MENNQNLEIGQKVTWNINQFKMTGAVLEDKGDLVSIQTHFRDACPCYQQVEVEKVELTKVTN